MLKGEHLGAEGQSYRNVCGEEGIHLQMANRTTGLGVRDGSGLRLKELTAQPGTEAKTVT